MANSEVISQNNLRVIETELGGNPATKITYNEVSLNGNQVVVEDDGNERLFSRVERKTIFLDKV
jgi:hypothetical protein